MALSDVVVGLVAVAVVAVVDGRAEVDEDAVVRGRRGDRDVL